MYRQETNTCPNCYGVTWQRSCPGCGTLLTVRTMTAPTDPAPLPPVPALAPVPKQACDRLAVMLVRQQRRQRVSRASFHPRTMAARLDAAMTRRSEDRTETVFSTAALTQAWRRVSDATAHLTMAWPSPDKKPGEGS